MNLLRRGKVHNAPLCFSNTRLPHQPSSRLSLHLSFASSSGPVDASYIRARYFAVLLSFLESVSLIQPATWRSDVTQVCPSGSRSRSLERRVGDASDVASSLGALSAAAGSLGIPGRPRESEMSPARRAAPSRHVKSSDLKRRADALSRATRNTRPTHTRARKCIPLAGDACPYV